MMDKRTGFESDEPHKQVYVEKILDTIKDTHKEVGVFNSAIELCGWSDNGFEFLYDFAMAALEELRLSERGK